jgi:hypothetical protein
MKKNHSLGTFFSILLVGAGLSMSAALAHAGQYALDDGSSEDSIGLTAGGDLIALNEFTATPGNNIITSIDMAWGTPAFPDASLNGLSYTAVLWSDPNGDGDPTDAQVLATTTGVVVGAGTDVFEFNAITPTAVSGNFFVGFLITGAAGQYPASLDESSADQMRSYVAGGNAGTGDIYDLSNNGLPVGSLDSVGLPGNWLIRADAVPEPSTWAMVGLGGALLLGLMRYRARVS